MQKGLENVLFEQQIEQMENQTSKEISLAQMEARLDAKNEKMKYLIAGTIVGAAIVQITYMVALATMRMMR